MGNRFKYPPCNLNPVTEKPYTRHKWIVPEGLSFITKETKRGPVSYYRVRCARCGINDPNAPLH